MKISIGAVWPFLVASAFIASANSEQAAVPQESRDGRYDTNCFGGPKGECDIGFSQLISHCERYDGRRVRFAAVISTYEDQMILWNSYENFLFARYEEAIAVDMNTLRLPDEELKFALKLANVADTGKGFRVIKVRGTFSCERKSGQPMPVIGLLKELRAVDEAPMQVWPKP